MAILVARFLGVEQYGTFATILAIATLSSILWPTSLGQAFMKFVGHAQGANDHGAAALVARHVTMRAIQSVASLGLISALILWGIERDLHPGALFAQIALTAAVSFQLFGRGVHLAANAMRREAYCLIASVVVGTLVAVGLAALGFPGWTCALGLAAGQLFYAFLAWPKTVPGKIATKARREIDLFVTLMALGSIASVGFMQLGVLAVSIRGEAGYYAAAVSLATPVALTGLALSMLLNPVMARAIGSGDIAAAGAKWEWATGAVVAVLTPLVTCAVIWSDRLIPRVLGEEYGETAALFPALLLSQWFLNIASPSSVLLSSGPQRDTIINTVTMWAGVLAGAAWWMVHWSSENSAGTQIANGVLLATATTTVLKVSQASRRSQHRLPVALLALSGVSIAGSWLVLHQGENLSAVVDLALSIGVLVVWAPVALRLVRRR